LKDEDTFTLLLGAGASLSSGAPTTHKLERCWLDAYPTRLRCRDELRENLGELTEQEKQSAIKGLFGELHPHIGYHCLAALGRERRILVVNLNWDDALDRACEQLGVPHEYVELGEGAGVVTQRLEQFSQGVFILHLHNRLERFGGRHPIGFTTYETLRFDERGLIAKEFFSRQTLVVGASLKGEHDVSDLLLTVASEPGESTVDDRPFWVFSRQEEESNEPADRMTRRVLSRKESDLNFKGGPAVDFDRLMLELCSRLAQMTLPDRADLDNVAFPSPTVLAGYLDAPPRGVSVIRGDALAGKSQAAQILEFLAELTEAPAPEVQIANGPTECEMALSRFVEIPLKEAYANRLLILEDPFGTTGDYDPNKSLVKAMRRFLREARRIHGRIPRARVIITTRMSCWQRALGEHGKILADLYTCSANAADWYSIDELGAYLETLVQGRDAQARREISTGEMLTPMAIREALSSGSPGARGQDVIAEKQAFLEVLSDEDAFFAVLARLQQLSPNACSHLPLQDEHPKPDVALVTLHHMLRTTELEGQVYVTPAHSSDRDAIDTFFLGHRARMQPRIDAVRERRGPMTDPCQVWDAAQSVAAGDVDPAVQLEPAVLADWAASLLGETARRSGASATAELLDRLPWQKLDFFCRREIVFELIRFWPMLRGKPKVKEVLESVLEDLTGYGRYLVLEAMLYLQAATYPDAWDLSGHAEVWDKLAAARWILFNEPATATSELGLIVDGLVWCPPRVADDEMGRWLRPLGEAAQEHDALLAAFLFASLYHPHGSRIFGELDIPDPAAGFGEHSLSVAQAAVAVELIEWHLLHQSRARALRYRRDLEPAHAYLLHRGTPPAAQTLPPDQQRRCKHLIEALGAHPQHAGWAIHLGMNVNATLGSFDERFMADMVTSLPTADLGLITAVLTYPVPSQLRDAVADYFRIDVNFKALFDAMRDAPVVWGMSMAPPRFNAIRSPDAIYRDLGITWKRLVEDRVLFDGETRFLDDLHQSALEVLQEAPEAERAELRDHVWGVVAETRRGDRRALERVALRNLRGGKLTPHEKLRERLQAAARARKPAP
jgi:hypothetical protein